MHVLLKDPSLCSLLHFGSGPVWVRWIAVHGLYHAPAWSWDSTALGCDMRTLQYTLPYRTNVVPLSTEHKQTHKWSHFCLKTFVTCCRKHFFMLKLHKSTFFYMKNGSNDLCKRAHLKRWTRLQLLPALWNTNAPSTSLILFLYFIVTVQSHHSHKCCFQLQQAAVLS